jgi:hypothetical protein
MADSGANRCVLINKHCKNQICEEITLGRYGSPGPVGDNERLYRVLIAPVDIGMTAEQIVLTAITHSQTIGMSVLRDRATDGEFHEIVNARTSQNGRTFVAVAELACGAIRSFRSERDEPGRLAGERHFMVLDTDMHRLPDHADVFNTVPAQTGSERPSNKAIWRRERGRLLNLANANIIKRQDFRDGRI